LDESGGIASRSDDVEWTGGLTALLEPASHRHVGEVNQMVAMNVGQEQCGEFGWRRAGIRKA
jgi:hypothetical protein